MLFRSAAGSSARDRSPLVGEYGWAIGVGIIILAVSLGRTLRALGHAFGDRGARRQPPGQAADPELRADVDEMRQRLAELEERVDFAERLLAKRREGERLPPPGRATPPPPPPPRPPVPPSCTPRAPRGSDPTPGGSAPPGGAGENHTLNPSHT